MMAKEKYAIRQIDFQSHGYYKYLCNNIEGDYFIIPVSQSILLLFDSKNEAINYIESKGLGNCEIFGVFMNEEK